MKIIITGGSGFIGTNLLDFFLKHNYNVINYDINTPKNSVHFKHWTKINILDKEKLAIQLNIDQPEFIIHLAPRTDLNEKKDIKGATKRLKDMSSRSRFPAIRELGKVIIEELNRFSNKA
jgi:nucleoside-diphosphate-sugar epimerase